MRTVHSTTLVALLAAVVACKGSKQADQEKQVQTVASPGGVPPPEEEESSTDEAGGTGTEMVLEEGKMGKRDDAAERPSKVAFGAASTRAQHDVAKPDKKQKPKDAGGKNSAETGVRAWFPETFLFEPLVVTDGNGEATVPVRVPDRLTTWRVLALGHSRQGAQGGAVTSFLGTLPTYVDLVVPKFLVVGDQIKLPVQIVNTTTSPVTSGLELSAIGARLASAGGRRTVPAEGSVVDYATLTANQAGTIEVMAGLGATDAVRRTIEVRPSGRPETVTRAGTLAAPRTLTIEGPAGSDPETDRVRLLVYPGALAVLRSELGVSISRSGVADDAYALLLAGRAPTLLAALGDKADPEALRTLAILTGQRAIRHGRTLQVWSATLLTEAALAHPNNPVLARLGERAAAFLAQQQRPDGTFSGGKGWTLQRVLVTTADATRAVAAAHLTTAERHRAKSVQVRARGAFARNAEHIKDGYTAAAILASGAVDGPLADKLRELVRAAIKPSDDGSKYLDVADGVVRADGAVPGRAEATALAVLALIADPKAPVADLGATLLGTYSPDHGWGEGRANLACMQAVLELFKTPVPDGVKVTLLMDGVPVTTGTLDRAALRDVLALEAAAPGFAGAHEWKIEAEPAVAGLGFALELRGWTPWPKQATTGGLEMSITPSPAVGVVGKPLEISLAAVAPSGGALTVVQSLPAGVQVDTPSLEALVAAGTITTFKATEGSLELSIPPLSPGQTFSAKFRVIPTLAGTLRTAASSISVGGTRYYVQPSSWTIR